MNLGEYIRYAETVFKDWIEARPAIQTKEYTELRDSQAVMLISLFELDYSVKVEDTARFLITVPTIPDLMAKITFFGSPSKYELKVFSQIDQATEKGHKTRNLAKLWAENEAYTEKLKKECPEIFDEKLLH